MLPTTWRHRQGGIVKLDAAREGPMVCPTCDEPGSNRKRPRDEEVEQDIRPPSVWGSHSSRPEPEDARERPEVSNRSSRPESE
eukprot:10650657-Heterocapsa_arctica.AAC.1